MSWKNIIDIYISLSFRLHLSLISQWYKPERKVMISDFRSASPNLLPVFNRCNGQKYRTWSWHFHPCKGLLIPWYGEDLKKVILSRSNTPFWTLREFWFLSLLVYGRLAFHWKSEHSNAMHILECESDLDENGNFRTINGIIIHLENLTIWCMNV
jgi:hypothetical protein